MSAAVFRTIAKEVGVSPRTVQRILCGELKDTRPTIVHRAQRIRELAEAMNYRPNLAARATASGRFGCVSLIRPTSYRLAHFSGELADAIEQELAINDLHLVVQRLTDEQLTSEEFLPKSLRTVMSDGLLINYTHNIPKAMRDVIQRDRIPTVWMNAKLPTDCVFPDDVQAGQMATEYLLSRGHRDVAYLFLGDYSSHYSEADREAGYRKAMKAAGATARVEQVPYERQPKDQPGPYRDGRFDLARQWLQRPNRPRAVVTYSAWTAHPLYAAALSLGLKVPEDLAITTIEDHVASELGSPLPTICLNMEELGRQAVRMLVEKINKPRKSFPPVKVTPYLIEPASA